MLFAQIITYTFQSKPGNGKANSFQPSGSTHKYLSATVTKKFLTITKEAAEMLP